MAHSPASSDLSDPPSDDYDERLSTPAASSRPSVDLHATHDTEHLAPPSKRRRTGLSTLSNIDRAPSPLPELEAADIDLSSDSEASAPGSPTHDEYALRDDAQTKCLWQGCDHDDTGNNNDDLVHHVQATHCATGGPKRKQYLCLWGECAKKTSSHPSGYALKAHMRSHTKEKPYYCALPECDRAFTRSDALAKHMRTVHEPEAPRGSGGKDSNDSTPASKKPVKLKLPNGTASKHNTEHASIVDEDGNQVDPSPPNDNITYIPAHHPITGQPGFMIHYPPDIHFSAWESSIAADQLMRLLRRQLHWARKEGVELKRDCDELELQKREEWTLKEVLLEGVMEAELARADRKQLLHDMDRHAINAMKHDAESAKELAWLGSVPSWRRQQQDQLADADEPMVTPPERLANEEDAGSPPPTGNSGGFDGSDNPYDNYVASMTAAYEERERQRSRGNSLQNTPHKAAEAPSGRQAGAEQDAAGALMGLSSAVKGTTES